MLKETRGVGNLANSGGTLRETPSSMVKRRCGVYPALGSGREAVQAGRSKCSHSLAEPVAEAAHLA